jgi:hypothetical protein
LFRSRHSAWLIWSKLTVTLLVASGIVSFTVGIYGDFNDWWSDKPYATNIFTAFTSACFGIPIAVVLLRKLATMQVDYTQRKKAKAILQVSSNEISYVLNETYNGDLDAVDSLSSFLAYCSKRMLQLHTLDKSTSAIREVKYFVSELSQLRSQVENLLPNKSLAAQLKAQNSHAWTAIDEYVKPILFGTDADWSTTSSYSRLEYASQLQFLESEDVTSRIDGLSQNATIFSNDPTRKMPAHGWINSGTNHIFANFAEKLASHRDVHGAAQDRIKILNTALSEINTK